MPMPIQLENTEIPDVRIVKTGCATDDRGFFSESYSRAVWAEAGFHADFVQDNLSLSAKGVVRGLHYQLAPHGTGKLVRVIAGAVFDVAVDLRRGSPSFGQWTGLELSAANRLTLWVPVGFAHGFLALEDNTYVAYKCTHYHVPEAERAIHYADPQLDIRWPFTPTLVSKKDALAPSLETAEYNFVFGA